MISAARDVAISFSFTITKTNREATMERDNGYVPKPKPIKRANQQQAIYYLARYPGYGGTGRKVWPGLGERCLDFAVSPNG
jgi:hypothetical protein